MRKKPLLIIIVGPTASGKSDAALRLAKKINGEIISADSRQIYRGLNIGTAKIKGVWKRNTFIAGGIPHFCIDTADPRHGVTAVEFKQRAQQAIADIHDRSKIPILVGGTGFWIDAVVYDMDFPHVAPNKALRLRLEKKTIPELLAMLKKCDARRAALIEQKNPRRLIRAIEIAHALGSVPATVEKRHPYRTLWIGLCPDQETLKKRIITRSAAMITGGLVRETKRIIAKKISKKRIKEFGFEYTAALHFIEKKINRPELERVLVRDTVAYARRQMRWFKKNQDIRWVTTTRQAEQLATRFIFKKPQRIPVNAGKMK